MLYNIIKKYFLHKVQVRRENSSLKIVMNRTALANEIEMEKIDH